MSYVALYRKYRPDNFGDLVGQSELMNIIKTEILTGKISHAYLFSGPRGTGKTSTAKIIARMINCSDLSEDGTPCFKCESCLHFNASSDVIEIDAASNNGVDEIRELRDNVNLVPTFGRFKIYIIDEVHMLTTPAFNALLKTLEEPPSHVIFILATTEVHRIPDTVVSRCQKFQFFRFTIDDIVGRLKYIANEEKIDISDEILSEIARLSAGGLRDAIGMLDQLSSYGENLTVDDVYQLNGVISYVELNKLLVNIHSQNIVDIIHFIDDIDRKGKSIERFIEDLIDFCKDILIYKSASIVNTNVLEKNELLVNLSNLYSESQLYALIEDLNELSSKIKNSSYGKILLVTTFIKLSRSIQVSLEEEKVNGTMSVVSSTDNSHVISNKSDTVVESGVISVPKKNLFALTGISDKVRKIRINNAFCLASKDLKEKLKNNWFHVEDKLSNDSRYVAIAGMMNDVEILVVGKENIIFLAQYNSLLDRLHSQIDLIENLLKEVFQTPYKPVFLLKDEWNFEKERYITNLKNGKKYEYIKEDEMPSYQGEMDEEASILKDDIEQITSIFGSDVISYNNN